MSIVLYSMVFAHFLCNANAEMRLLDQDEATFCSSNFEDLKVTLNPDIDLTSFHRLETRDKARLSVESYRSYRGWLAENAPSVEAIQMAARSVARGGSLIPLLD